MKFSIEVGSQEYRDLINDKIVDFNAQKAPFTQEDEFIYLDYVIKNTDKVIGGISAIIYCWKCLYIDVIWVEEEYRHQGFGAKLLQKVEEEAKKSGCHLSHLDTFDFQAKDFYLNNGYEIFGELKDCPPGHSRFYLKKIL